MEVLFVEVRQVEGKRIGISFGKELPQFADFMIIYIENPKHSIKNLLAIIINLTERKQVAKSV